ncbi:MAG: hypothetical protein ACOCQR_02730 [bacterium]
MFKFKKIIILVIILSLSISSYALAEKAAMREFQKGTSLEPTTDTEEAQNIHGNGSEQATGISNDEQIRLQTNEDQTENNTILYYKRNANKYENQAIDIRVKLQRELDSSEWIAYDHTDNIKIIGETPAYAGEHSFINLHGTFQKSPQGYYYIEVINSKLSAPTSFSPLIRFEQSAQSFLNTEVVLMGTPKIENNDDAFYELADDTASIRINIEDSHDKSNGKLIHQGETIIDHSRKIINNILEKSGVKEHPNDTELTTEELREKINDQFTNEEQGWQTGKPPLNADYIINSMKVKGIVKRDDKGFFLEQTGYKIISGYSTDSKLEEGTIEYYIAHYRDYIGSPITLNKKRGFKLEYATTTPINTEHVFYPDWYVGDDTGRLAVVGGKTHLDMPDDFQQKHINVVNQSIENVNLYGYMEKLRTAKGKYDLVGKLLQGKDGTLYLEGLEIRKVKKPKKEKSCNLLEKAIDFIWVFDDNC